MKKISSRSVVFTLLLLASISSYVFLTNFAPAATAFGAEERTEEAVTVEKEYALPDVMLMKEIIDLGKRITRIGR
jgi:hypothetical protein